jgi:hypothetical protein
MDDQLPLPGDVGDVGDAIVEHLSSTGSDLATNPVGLQAQDR